ncbi:subtilisin family serine protease [Hamadaea flava]|uniref:S8 family serine peptidase n=1 Tax=Hamadaea flava TaxID=1742688 RepID=A0ABV8LQ93_9ACTN|nr:S8 family serine peptidase [Hamadaea flava]MCP2322470.1 subtilisin family serine protease [Hamadaea flava]
MLRHRREGSRVLAAAFALAVLVGGVPAGAAPSGPVNANPTATTNGGIRATLPGRAHTVTLITGDVLRVADSGRISVIRGNGRDHITFASYQSKGHLHVIPSDARPLLAAGRLDSRLFDVTALIQFRYDDRRVDLPLIVTAKSAPPADTGLKLTRSLKAVHGSAGRADKGKLGTLWKGLTGSDSRLAAQPLATAKIWLDGVRKPTLDVSVPLIGAPTAWQAGYTGAGVKVAVLDTGIDETHPDLAGKVIARQNFAAADYPDEDDRDHVGHGTHVASTIAGSGAASGGRYKGVAPDAQLLNGKICVDVGCAESWILAGMQWAAEQGADVVNLSLGGPDTPDIDPLEQAVNDLTAQYGTLFVIAAGNDGEFGDRTVGSPASADAALAVAATSKTDELAEFSSRGPRVGDAAVKPEISAPGVDIVAACSSVGFLCTPGEPYATLSGTSMATPHTVGSAALLVQEHPQWTPAQVKATLMGSAKPLDGIAAFGQGAGRVDVARAIGQTITAEAPSVSFGLAAWPHGDDTPITKTVTYHNSGTADVTLTLALHTTGAGDPGSLFSLSAPTVTVPAGGSASVTLTADTRADVADGFYSGQLVGTASGVSVSVPYGVEKEVESYDITFEHISRDGTPNDSHLTILNGGGVSEYVLFGGGAETIRLPKGEYFVNSWLDDLDERSTTMLIQPKLVVAATGTAVLDMRTARPVRTKVPDPAAINVATILDAEYTFPNGSAAGFGLLGDEGLGKLYSGLIGPSPVEGLSSSVTSGWATPGPDGTLFNAPSMYNLAWYFPKSFPTGLDKQLAKRDLATVKATYHQNAPGLESVVFSHPTPVNDPLGGGWSMGVSFQTPFQRTLYFNGDAAWQDEYQEQDWSDPEGGKWAYQTGPRRVLKPGRTTAESWNAPVFGPAFGTAQYPFQYLVRSGDELIIGPPTFGDGAGHAGFSAYASAKSTLYRNGVKIAESTDPYLDVEVPPEAANYKVVTEVTRDSRFSTKVTASWSFRSKHVEVGDDPLAGFARLPVTSVSFAPDIDAATGLASPAPIAMVPITVAGQPDSGTAPLRKLKVDYSTDGGKTWHSVLVVQAGPAWYAFLPQKAGSTISLRAQGSDASGVVVEQTIIGAYQVKK